MTKKTEKLQSLRHKFVESFPDQLEPGVIYVSMRFASASHLCCCGCGNEVVTPISPHEWHLIFDGKTISLKPSIGNWGLPCRSHYWITRGQVEWAGKWTANEIEEGRARDTADRNDFFDKGKKEKSASSTSATLKARSERLSFWQRIKIKLKN
jgi:hypothetical protein